MIYSFTWNGTNCRTVGIRLQSMPEVVRPEERVSHVIVPGRSGEMTLTEGDDIYNSYIQTIPIAVNTLAAVKQAETWLKGAGWVTFGGEPNLKQYARIINAVTFRKHGRNSNWWDAEVQFYCDPIKYSTSEEPIEITTSGTTITNAGDLKSFPRIAITGSGLVTVKIGGNTLTIPSCVDGWVIDTENEWILQNGVPQTNVCSGKFPTLAVGDNVITFTGATKVTVAPNIRYL